MFSLRKVFEQTQARQVAVGHFDGDLRQAIAAGINIIHINTELRVAWRRGLEAGLSSDPREIVPYKILPFAVAAIKQVATSRLKLFNNPG